MDDLNRLDLAFCVDLTGSMSPFIHAARAQMSRVLSALRAELGDGLEVAIVGYRDHSDGKRLLDVFPLTSDIAAASKRLDGLQIMGGGDAPEAVYSGLDACLKLAWRSGSYRVVILVGDAPPHAVGAVGDHYAKRDPSGYSLDDMANKLEEEGVFVHALSLTPRDTILETSFKRLSISTGGDYHDATSADAAVRLVEQVTQRFLRDIELDRSVLAAIKSGVKAPEPASEDESVPSRAEILAKHLRLDVKDVYGALMRLRQRRLLSGLE